MSTLKDNTDSAYVILARWWLVFIILLQPFHDLLIKTSGLWNQDLASTIARFDEITIVLFSLLALREYSIRKYSFRIQLLWFIPVFIFILSGVISGIVNGNTLLGTSHALFLYVRNFFCLFIYSAFFRDKGDFNKIFRYILIGGIVISVTAVFQEVLAFIYRYLPGSGIEDTFFGSDSFMIVSRWRLGIYRPSSLMSHYNLFGIYLLMLLTIYMSLIRRINIYIFIFLLSGVLLSLSRGVYAGFIAVLALHIYKGRKRMLIVLLPVIIILLFSWIHSSEFEFQDLQKRQLTYREYARQKALEVWKDNVFWGVGPGMFGWGIAAKYNSHFYEEYNFSDITSRKDLDQFWPQLLSDVGLVGTLSYISLIICIYFMFLLLKSLAVSDENKAIFGSLALFIVVLLAYSFTSSFEIAPVLYTYMALAGIEIGSSDNT